MKRKKRRTRSKAFSGIKPSSSRRPSGSVRNFIIVILFAVLVATGILATRARVESKNRKKELEAAATKLNEDAAPNGSIQAEIENAVKARDTADLMALMERLKIEPDEHFAIQLEKIKNRLVITEALEDGSTDPAIRQFALLSELDALTLWHSLNVIYEVDSSTQRDELEQRAGSHVDDEDPKVAARANYVLALVEIHRFIITGDPREFQQGLKHYRRTLEEVGDDVNEAVRISNLASLLAKSGNENEVRQMWELFFNRFKSSDNVVIQSLADKAYDQFVFAGSPLAASLRKILAGDAEALPVFQDQVYTIVGSHSLSNSGFDRLLAMLEVLVQTGDVTQVKSVAKNLMDRLPEIARNADAELVSRKLESLINRASLVGQEFDFSGLVGDSGTVFQPVALEGCKVLIAFWSPDKPKSMERLTGVHKMVGMFDGSRLRLIAIALSGSLERGANGPPSDEIPSTADDKNTAVFKKNLPNCSFVKINPRDEKLAELLSRLGPPFLPYIVMVNMEHEIEALNPNPEDLIQLLDVGAVKKTE